MPFSAAPTQLRKPATKVAETALLGRNPYTDQQLVTNAIHLLLTTRLYIQLFK
jgi:hypothetical protein